MKKSIILIIASIFSNMLFANLSDIKVSPKISVSYDQTKITNKTLNDIGLGSLLENNSDYIRNNLDLSLGANAKYELNFDKHSLLLGAGLDFVTKFNVYDNSEFILKKQNEEKYEIYYLENKLYNLERKYTEENEKTSAYIYEMQAITTQYKELKQTIDAAKKSKDGSEKSLQNYVELKKKYPNDAAVEQLKKDLAAAKAEYENNPIETERLQNERNDYFIKELKGDFIKSLTDKKYKEYTDKILALRKALPTITKKYANLKSDYETIITINESIDYSLNNYSENDAIVKVLEKVRTKIVEDLKSRDIVIDEETGEIEGSADLQKEKTEELLKTKAELEKAMESYYSEVKIYSNNEAISDFKDINKKMVSLGANGYLTAEYNYSINDDLKLLVDLSAGIKVLSNPVYMLSKELENRKTEIDGKQYVASSNLQKVNVNGFVNVGIGAIYKGFGTKLFTGYGNGLVGLEFSYRH